MKKHKIPKVDCVREMVKAHNNEILKKPYISR